MNAFRLFVGVVYGAPFCVILSHWIANAVHSLH